MVTIWGNIDLIGDTTASDLGYSNLVKCTIEEDQIPVTLGTCLYFEYLSSSKCLLHILIILYSSTQ